jgi:hypothetical protein
MRPAVNLMVSFSPCGMLGIPGRCGQVFCGGVSANRRLQIFWRGKAVAGFYLATTPAWLLDAAGFSLQLAAGYGASELSCYWE